MNISSIRSISKGFSVPLILSKLQSKRHCINYQITCMPEQVDDDNEFIQNCQTYIYNWGFLSLVRHFVQTKHVTENKLAYVIYHSFFFFFVIKISHNLIIIHFRTYIHEWDMWWVGQAFPFCYKVERLNGTQWTYWTYETCSCIHQSIFLHILILLLCLKIFTSHTQKNPKYKFLYSLYQFYGDLFIIILII